MVKSLKRHPAGLSNRGTKTRFSWWSRARERPLGAHILSWDFAGGILGGLGIGALFTLSQGVRAEAFTFFLTLGGISAGLAALVLAPMGMLLSSLSPGFIEMINRTPSGLRGLLLPFRSVAAIAAVGAVLALGASLASLTEFPTLPGWVHFIGTSAPGAAFCWAVFGCIQVVGVSVDMIEKDRSFRSLAERRDRAQIKAS